MKKGVVLLITLFFISTISLLVLKNLDDTDKFLVEQNYVLNNTQVLISIKNTKDEVSKLLKKYKDEVDKILAEGLIVLPINLEGLNIIISFDIYDRVNINDIKKESSTTVKDLFISYNISNYNDFESIYKEKLSKSNQKVQTNKQLDDIISTFIKKVENKKIEEIRDYLGFIDAENLYELNISSSYLTTKAEAVYLLNKEGKVQYFDISFK